MLEVAVQWKVTFLPDIGQEFRKIRLWPKIHLIENITALISRGSLLTFTLAAFHITELPSHQSLSHRAQSESIWPSRITKNYLPALRAWAYILITSLENLNPRRFHGHRSIVCTGLSGEIQSIFLCLVNPSEIHRLWNFVNSGSWIATRYLGDYVDYNESMSISCVVFVWTGVTDDVFSPRAPVICGCNLPS